MFNKKAVSDVVSTVLIILLVVAAVAIVGAIVLKVVGNAGPKVDYAVQCQALEVNANACALSGTAGSAVTSASFIRGSGGSGTTLDSVEVIFEKDDGSSVTSTTVSSGLNTPFTPVTVPLIGLSTSGTTQIVVAGRISGAKDYCTVSQPVKCSLS